MNGTHGGADEKVREQGLGTHGLEFLTTPRVSTEMSELLLVWMETHTTVKRSILPVNGIIQTFENSCHFKPISKLEKNNNKSDFFKKAGNFKLLDDPIYS